MSVLDRSALEASPLADLHAVASELSIDGYRRLRRADLIGAILDKQGGGDGLPADSPADSPEPAEEKPAPRPRSRRASSAEAEPEPPAAKDEGDGDDDRASSGQRSRRRGGRNRGGARNEERAPSERGGPAEKGPAERETQADADSEPLVEGVVELLPGGSGFVRVNPPEPSDGDVYISSAQIKRCELVAGDRVAGPKRPPRRSERFASMIRIETINDRPASEVADSVRFDDLPASFPSEQLKLGSDDATLKAIDTLTPIGKGSRVSIVGPARAGKTEALKRIAQTLAEHENLAVQVILAGARPEEITEWAQGPVSPAASLSLTASEDTQSSIVESAIDQARRLAARGADAVVLIDSLTGCAPGVARRALGAARNIVDGGSLTVIATAAAPIGGETTVIVLDAVGAGAGRFPALDVLASGVLRPELLVGEKGTKAITKARNDAAKAE